MNKLIWYAAYGSNLLRKRFLTYIRGGRVPGTTTDQIGCTDSTAPREDRGILILHRLFFGDAAPQWEGGGVAFIKKRKDEEAKTLGRMYLISQEQFLEIHLQENGYGDLTADLGVDLARTIREGRTEIPGLKYGALLHLGEEGGHPIFTFTGPAETGKAVNRPGPNYLTVIAQGLKETFGLSEEGVAEYLQEVPGIRGLIPSEELHRIAQRPPL